MRIALITLLVLFAACKTVEYVEVPVLAPTPPPVEPFYGQTSTLLNGLMDQAFEGTRAVEVFYATNRDGDGGCGEDQFGVERADSLRFGSCSLNVPKLHAVGQIEAASSPRDDPNRYYRVLRHRPLSEARFMAAVADSAFTDLLVVVHGFNVPFDQATLRAAQLAYDLKFQGPVVLFSWPAGARSGFSFINRTYARNRENAEGTVDAASALLEQLGRLPSKAHLLVHSMGHQVIVPALDAIAARSDSVQFGELVLNAPDIDLERFTHMAPSLVGMARRVTVYCSYNDNAIAASEAYNDGRRLGACERIDGVDVINVGEIDAPAMGVAGLGHGYYASRPILTDVYQVLLGIDATRRLFIREAEPNSTQDFYLRR